MLRFLLKMALVLSLAVPALSQELTAPEERLISLFETSRSSVVSITTGQRRLDPWQRRAEIVPSGSGSGFFWGDEGHIVTNAHVIQRAIRADIHLADGRVLPARLVGAAPQYDLAVLQVDLDGEAAEPLQNGNSGDLRVGQSVLAIGNPFGLDWTLTTGIVSALGREVPIGNGMIEGLIQTDAAINPGNSGGPLLDSSGRLIGVNTAIFSPSGASSGIGFAVPVDLVKRVVPQLIANGVYRPPVLGIRFDPRINQLTRQNGIEGVVILSVEPGGPAEAARAEGGATWSKWRPSIRRYHSASRHTSDSNWGRLERSGSMIMKPETKLLCKSGKTGKPGRSPYALPHRKG